MNTFIEKICDDILLRYRDCISDICIIFPSRRAGYYLKNILSRKLDVPVWSPGVYSIEDFIEENSQYKIADDIKLLTELYSVYSSVVANQEKGTEQGQEDSESFDTFYPWGEMLLRDFDLIDKYIADANLLFKNIKDLKDIEENFPLELQEDFKKFWGTLFDSKKTNAKEDFLKIWQVLGKVYFEYTEHLKQKGICYPGLAYRKMYEDAENILSGLKWKKIIFAGFNSLNPVEKKIMKTLVNKGIAEIYWDADDYYISDTNQEAGDFLRKNFKFFNPDKIELEKNLVSDSKRINVIGTSTSAGMAKVLGNELRKQLQQKEFEIEKTAVVLPEAKLLLPVLYSIPDEIKGVNITMGFPFRDTLLYSLIYLIIELQNDFVFEKGKTRFKHSVVKKILLHPYVKFQDTVLVYHIIKFIKDNNIIYFSIDDLKPGVPKLLEYVFKKAGNQSEAVNYLSDIIDFIYTKIEKDDSKDAEYKKFQLEIIYSFYSNFRRLNEVIKESEIKMSLDTYWRLLKSLMQKISIPLTGEPLKGLQVMGLLETRTLDFENVFILSANEGVLPEGRYQNSFIPFSLRKALKMPTYEDEDSVTAYYFYRLLQRAKNIFIVYNTDIGKDAKEKSRYILQIENELALLNKNIKFENKLVIPEIYNIGKSDIEIKKSKDVIKKLKELKHFSPTTIKTYINCSLQFYFKYIAKLKEEEEIEDTFDSRLVGEVLHTIMEELYRPFESKIINEKDINDIENSVMSDFDDVLEKAVRTCKSEYILKKYNGKNKLFKNIILKLLLRVLENEKIQAPFKIIDIEKTIDSVYTFSKNNDKIDVKINGRIDRIDEKNGVIRIIDYKTGSYDLKKFDEKNPAEYFEKLITNPDYKDNFQAFFYGYFYSKMNESEKINVGIYPVKKIQNGIDSLKENFIGKKEFELFGFYLEKLFSEMFAPELPFKQAEDEKRCTYCPYASLCYRDLKNTI